MVEALQCLCVAFAFVCVVRMQEVLAQVRQLDESVEKANSAFVTKAEKSGKSVWHVNELCSCLTDAILKLRHSHTANDEYGVNGTTLAACAEWRAYWEYLNLTKTVLVSRLPLILLTTAGCREWQ